MGAEVGAWLPDPIGRCARVEYPRRRAKNYDEQQANGETGKRSRVGDSRNQLFDDEAHSTLDKWELLTQPAKLFDLVVAHCFAQA